MFSDQSSDLWTKIRNSLVGVLIIAAIFLIIWLTLPPVDEMPDELPPLPFSREPTMVPDDVGPLTPGDSVSGALVGQTDANAWSFTVEDEQMLNVGLDAEFYTTLHLVDSEGYVLASAAEGMGIADAVFCHLHFTEPGDFRIIVGSLVGSGGYQLELIPPHGEQIADTAQPIEPGQVYENQSTFCFDAAYRFEAVEGTPLSIRVTGLDGGIPHLRLFTIDESGQLGDELNVSLSSQDSTATVDDLLIDATGPYLLQIFQEEGRYLNYTVLLELAQ